MENIYAVRILDQFITERATTIDVWLARCTIVRLDQHFWRCRTGHFRFNAINLRLKPTDEIVCGLCCECQATDRHDFLKNQVQIAGRKIDNMHAKILELGIVLPGIFTITQHQIRFERYNLLNVILPIHIRNFRF